MTIIIPCSLGNSYCTFGFLIFIDERNYSLYILTEKSLKYLCSIRAWVPVSACLSLSLSLRLIPWSVETRLAHSPARASKTLSRRRPVPSWETKSCVKDVIGFLHKPGSISLFLSLSHRHLRTTRSQSIKGPQQVAPEQGHWCTGISVRGIQDLLRLGPIEVGKY